MADSILGLTITLLSISIFTITICNQKKVEKNLFQETDAYLAAVMLKSNSDLKSIILNDHIYILSKDNRVFDETENKKYEIKK